MAAYLVVDTRISDPDAYEDYKAKARPIAESFGGEYIARGGELEIIEDDLWSPTRIVLIRFPDMAAARAFTTSPEYAPLQDIRRDAAASTMAIVDGI